MWRLVLPGGRGFREGIVCIVRRQKIFLVHLGGGGVPQKQFGGCDFIRRMRKSCSSCLLQGVHPMVLSPHSRAWAIAKLQSASPVGEAQRPSTHWNSWCILMRPSNTGHVWPACATQPCLCTTHQNGISRLTSNRCCEGQKNSKELMIFAGQPRGLAVTVNQPGLDSFHAHFSAKHEMVMKWVKGSTPCYVYLDPTARFPQMQPLHVGRGDMHHVGVGFPISGMGALLDLVP